MDSIHVKTLNNQRSRMSRWQTPISKADRECPGCRFRFSCSVRHHSGRKHSWKTGGGLILVVDLLCDHVRAEPFEGYGRQRTVRFDGLDCVTKFGGQSCVLLLQTDTHACAEQAAGNPRYTKLRRGGVFRPEKCLPDGEVCHPSSIRSATRLRLGLFCLS